MESAIISKPTLGRLPRYLSYLRQLPLKAVPHISSTTIARDLGLGEVLVRKDLAAVSGAGKPRLGYATAELIEALEEYLGHRNSTAAVLVGAGRLGRALLGYGGFERYGVHIAAAFDTSDGVLSPDSQPPILAAEQLTDYCRSNGIRLGIITVGADAAQQVCDRMLQGGITAIWNFAPCKIQVPDGVILKNEDLALSLAYLSNQLGRSRANPD